MKQITLLLLLFCFAACQSKKTESFYPSNQLESVILDILSLAHENKIANINAQYIHPQHGVYDIYTLCITNNFERMDTIEFPTKRWSISSHLLEVKEVPSRIQAYNNQMNLDSCQWEKEGLFYSQSTDTLLSEVVYRNTKYEGHRYAKADLQRIKLIEAKSIRVMYTPAKLIFYLSKINDKWYLVAFDRSDPGC